MDVNERLRHERLTIVYFSERFHTFNGKFTRLHPPERENRRQIRWHCEPSLNDHLEQLRSLHMIPADQETPCAKSNRSLCVKASIIHLNLAWKSRKQTYGIWNPYVKWNPVSRYIWLESRIHVSESGIHGSESRIHVSRSQTNELNFGIHTLKFGFLCIGWNRNEINLCSLKHVSKARFELIYPT